jgi:hypothetical protein
MNLQEALENIRRYAEHDITSELSADEAVIDAILQLLDVDRDVIEFFKSTDPVIDTQEQAKLIVSIYEQLTKEPEIITTMRNSCKNQDATEEEQDQEFVNALFEIPSVRRKFLKDQRWVLETYFSFGYLAFDEAEKLLACYDSVMSNPTSEKLKRIKELESELSALKSEIGL